MSHFQALGYSPQVMDVPLPDGTTSHNVIVTKPGSSNLTIVIGAHMDSYGVSPGGNDNGSGSAAVLELARALKDVDLVPTVVLVLFGHEEPMGDGNADHHHYGSRRYVATMTADQKAEPRRDDLPGHDRLRQHASTSATGRRARALWSTCC